MSNLHPCAGKCSEFKDGGQCFHCSIQQIEKREFELGVALEDAYVKYGTSQVIDCTGISSKKVELRFKAGEVVVTASPEFKGGDWVVLADAVSRESSLAQILKTDGRWSIVQWLDDNTESNIRLDFLRHATDEEIAAGRRLPYPRRHENGLNDEHIENHISPLIERLKVENVVLQAKVDDLQKRLDAAKLDLSIFSDFIKRFDANTDTATIVGTLYGFVDELEQSLGGEA